MESSIIPVGAHCPLSPCCQDQETLLPEACEAGVKLAVQRLKMYQEDAVVAHQVLKPPPKKKDKKSEEKNTEEGE